MTGKKPIWSAAEIAAAEFTFRHPLDDRTETVIGGLSRLAGLTRSGVNITRIPPGRQAFPLHRHHVEEEWLYVLSGTAAVRMNETTHEVGAGGFVAFPAGGPAHSVTNPSDSETLVCLMGGNAVDADIVDFPEQGRRLNRIGHDIEMAPRDAFGPFDFFSKTPAPGHRT